MHLSIGILCFLTCPHRIKVVITLRSRTIAKVPAKIPRNWNRDAGHSREEVNAKALKGKTVRSREDGDEKRMQSKRAIAIRVSKYRFRHGQ